MQSGVPTAAREEAEETLDDATAPESASTAITFDDEKSLDEIIETYSR